MDEDAKVRKQAEERQDQILANALAFLHTNTKDIELNTLIQDKKYQEVIDRMVLISSACGQISTVMHLRKLKETFQKS